VLSFFPPPPLPYSGIPSVRSHLRCFLAFPFPLNLFGTLPPFSPPLPSSFGRVLPKLAECDRFPVCQKCCPFFSPLSSCLVSVPKEWIPAACNFLLCNQDSHLSFFLFFHFSLVCKANGSPLFFKNNFPSLPFFSGPFVRIFFPRAAFFFYCALFFSLFFSFDHIYCPFRWAFGRILSFRFVGQALFFFPFLSSCFYSRLISH